MQGGVIGGICLLACLLSLSHAEEPGDPKQVEEPEATERKDEESPSEDENFRRSNNDLTNFRITNDLKTDVNGSIASLVEEGIKLTSEIQNATQAVGDPSSSKESLSNRSSSESLAFPGIESPLSRQFVPETGDSGSVSYSLDSSHTAEQGSLQLSGVNSEAISNSYNTNIPARTQNVALYAAPMPNAPAYLPNIPNDEINYKSALRNSVNITTDPENSATTVDKFQETTSAKPIEKAFNQDQKPSPLFTNFLADLAKVAAPSTPYNPILSSEFAQSPIQDSLRPLGNSQPSAYTSNFNQFPPTYSYDSKTAFDQMRLSLPKDETQVRNADDNQYSETMNSYPFVSVSSRSDSSSSESQELRSGALYTPSISPVQSSESSAQAYAQAQSSNDVLTANNQGLNPYSYGYPPGADSQAAAQSTANGGTTGQSSGSVIEDGKSRVIMPHEYIFPHKIRGGENVIQCTRENELHHFWAPGFNCLVCICLNEYGLLEPVCASCSGCQTPAPPEPPPLVPDQSRPTPEPYIPLPVPDPYVPLPIPSMQPYTPSASAPSLILEPAVERDLDLTTPPSLKEVPVSCSPLPSGYPFPHPLSPCQQCICKEVTNALGKIEVRIDCQDSPHCVVPPELTTLPPIPDIPIPVPLPLCEKFPAQVSFPHPKEKCKLCKCSVGLSEAGVPEQQITCFGDGDCGPTPKPEQTQPGVTPPAPPIPIPVEPYPGPFPAPGVEPVPEDFRPVLPPNAVTPGEPLPWPPVSTPAPPLAPQLPRKVPGPLPGPSPHESCRPYPPNQPFQHPWDDCQVCECTESRAVGMINVEISCYTKLSCCIESPEQVISAIAGKSNSEANSGPDETQAKGLINPQTSTIKPVGYGSFNPVRQNKAYAEANAIVQNALNDPSYQLPYPSASAMSNAVVGQNQGYGDANAVAQSSISSPYPGSGGYQTANAYGSATSNGGHSSAEASADVSSIPGTYGAYNPGMLQSQAYAEANSIAQKGLINPAYRAPAPYQSIKPVATAPASQTSAENSEEYVPGSVNKPISAYPQYNPAVQSQTYADINAQYNRPMTSTYKPPALYAQYNPEASPNQAYAEAVAQYNELNTMTNTQKPASPYGQYNPNPPIAGVNGQYNIVTSTFKPSALYSQYSSETYPNPAYTQANAQYGTVTSTPRPGVYGQYNAGGTQTQAYQTPNAVYKGTPSQPYAGANTPSGLANPGYYISGPYQGKSLGSANAISTISGGDQATAIAEAIAQDYTPYLQPGSANPSGYQYPANYYTGYMSPQFASYPGRPDQGVEGYKQSPIKYAGNFDFNGQADGINVLGQNGYYPYGAGYGQTLPGYSSLYPKQTGYEISPMYRPGQFGGANAQSSAQAFSNLKMQTKSGEGLQEDSDDSK